MGKRQRSDDVVHIRLFDVLNRSTLSELPRREFSKEVEMQELIENNIEELFPNLTFLKREFRGMGDGELRPDTIAFDTARNSFVALEYKKKPDKAVVDQARSYVHFMGKNKAELAILYNEQKNTSHKPNSFNWKEVYAIIMTPDFSDYQISGAEEDKKIELYKIRMHDHIIMMQRVGGDHQQASVTGPAQKTHNRQSQKNTNPTTPDAGRRIEPARGGGVGNIRLPDVQYEKGQKVPANLTFPDGDMVKLKAWRGVLANVANWLVNEGRLDESHCPVPIGTKNAVLNTRPVHQNGKRFRSYEKAGRLYVFLNVSPENAISHAINLIGMAGLDPNNFAVSSGAPTTAPNRGNTAADGGRRIDPVRKGMGGYAVLSDIQYEKGQNPPKNLTYSDGSQTGLKAWADILYNIANWLVGKDYLDELHCPVPKGPKNAILNTQPVHQNGKPFRRPQKAGYLYVDMNVDPKSAIFCAIKLIKVAELDPSDFKVHF